MKHEKKKTVRCQICNQLIKSSKLMPAELVYLSLVESIVKKLPDWS